MSIHVIGVLALALVFVIGTVRPVNIGALALIATFFIGTMVAGETVRESLAGFPADLFVLLVGVTYLFGLASVNGTIQWVVERAAGLLGDRPAFVPWLIFFFSAIPTTAGALGPASVAMLAPLAFELGERYRLDRRMTALMVMHGVGLGNFSPLGGLTIIVRQAAETNGLEVSAAALFFGNAAYNLALAAAIYVGFGGIALIRGLRPAAAAAAANAPPLPFEDPVISEAGPAVDTPTAAVAPPPVLQQGAPLRLDQTITLAVIVAVGVGALAFDLEIGFLALIAAVFLHLTFPRRVEHADRRIVWSVVLLICGVVTLVGALQRYGTIGVVGTGIAGIGAPLLTAFLLCAVAAVTSAFASSAGLLGVLVPLAIPFLLQGEVGVTGMILALAVSATVVDATPFSSVGALIVASSPEDGRPRVFRAMLMWGALMAVSAPILTWLLFILPTGR